MKEEGEDTSGETNQQEPEENENKPRTLLRPPPPSQVPTDWAHGKLGRPVKPGELETPGVMSIEPEHKVPGKERENGGTIEAVLEKEPPSVTIAEERAVTGPEKGTAEARKNQEEANSGMEEKAKKVIEGPDQRAPKINELKEEEDEIQVQAEMPKLAPVLTQGHKQELEDHVMAKVTILRGGVRPAKDHRAHFQDQWDEEETEDQARSDAATKDAEDTELIWEDMALMEMDDDMGSGSDTDDFEGEGDDIMPRSKLAEFAAVVDEITADLDEKVPPQERSHDQEDDHEGDQDHPGEAGSSGPTRILKRGTVLGTAATWLGVMLLCLTTLTEATSTSLAEDEDTDPEDEENYKNQDGIFVSGLLMTIGTYLIVRCVLEHLLKKKEERMKRRQGILSRDPSHWTDADTEALEFFEDPGKDPRNPTTMILNNVSNRYIKLTNLRERVQGRESEEETVKVPDHPPESAQRDTMEKTRRDVKSSLMSPPMTVVMVTLAILWGSVFADAAPESAKPALDPRPWCSWARNLGMLLLTLKGGRLWFERIQKRKRQGDSKKHSTEVGGGQRPDHLEGDKETLRVHINPDLAVVLHHEEPRRQLRTATLTQTQIVCLVLCLLFWLAGRTRAERRPNKSHPTTDLETGLVWTVPWLAIAMWRVLVYLGRRTPVPRDGGTTLTIRVWKEEGEVTLSRQGLVELLFPHVSKEKKEEQEKPENAPTRPPRGIFNKRIGKTSPGVLGMKAGLSSVVLALTPRTTEACEWDKMKLWTTCLSAQEGTCYKETKITEDEENRPLLTPWTANAMMAVALAAVVVRLFIYLMEALDYHRSRAVLEEIQHHQSIRPIKILQARTLMNLVELSTFRAMDVYIQREIDHPNERETMRILGIDPSSPLFREAMSEELQEEPGEVVLEDYRVPRPRVEDLNGIGINAQRRLYLQGLMTRARVNMLWQGVESSRTEASEVMLRFNDWSYANPFPLRLAQATPMETAKKLWRCDIRPWIRVRAEEVRQALANLRADWKWSICSVGILLALFNGLLVLNNLIEDTERFTATRSWKDSLTQRAKELAGSLLGLVAIMATFLGLERPRYGGGNAVRRIAYGGLIMMSHAGLATKVPSREQERKWILSLSSSPAPLQQEEEEPTEKTNPGGRTDEEEMENNYHWWIFICCIMVMVLGAMRAYKWLVGPNQRGKNILRRASAQTWKHWSVLRAKMSESLTPIRPFLTSSWANVILLLITNYGLTTIIRVEEVQNLMLLALATFVAYMIWDDTETHWHERDKERLWKALRQAHSPMKAALTGGMSGRNTHRQDFFKYARENVHEVLTRWAPEGLPRTKKTTQISAMLAGRKAPGSIKCKLVEDRPYVETTMCNTKVTQLVDTGACINTVSKRVTMEIEEQLKCHLPVLEENVRGDLQIRSFSGDKVSYTRILKIPTRIGDKIYHLVYFEIDPEVLSDCILGINSLKHFARSLEFDEQAVRIVMKTDEKLNCVLSPMAQKLATVEDITIEPGKSKEVDMYCSLMGPHSRPLDPNGRRLSGRVQVKAAEGFDREGVDLDQVTEPNNKGRIPVLFHNSSPTPVFWPAGAEVAEMTVLTGESLEDRMEQIVKTEAESRGLDMKAVNQLDPIKCPCKLQHRLFIVDAAGEVGLGRTSEFREPDKPWVRGSDVKKIRGKTRLMYKDGTMMCADIGILFDPKGRYSDYRIPLVKLLRSWKINKITLVLRRPAQLSKGLTEMLLGLQLNHIEVVFRYLIPPTSEEESCQKCHRDLLAFNLERALTVRIPDVTLVIPINPAAPKDIDFNTIGGGKLGIIDVHDWAQMSYTQTSENAFTFVLHISEAGFIHDNMIGNIILNAMVQLKFSFPNSNYKIVTAPKNDETMKCGYRLDVLDKGVKHAIQALEYSFEWPDEKYLRPLRRATDLPKNKERLMLKRCSCPLCGLTKIKRTATIQLFKGKLKTLPTCLHNVGVEVEDAGDVFRDQWGHEAVRCGRRIADLGSDGEGDEEADSDSSTFNRFRSTKSTKGSRVKRPWEEEEEDSSDQEQGERKTLSLTTRTCRADLKRREDADPLNKPVTTEAVTQRAKEQLDTEKGLKIASLETTDLPSSLSQSWGNASASGNKEKLRRLCDPVKVGIEASLPLYHAGRDVEDLKEDGGRIYQPRKYGKIRLREKRSSSGRSAKPKKLSRMARWLLDTSNRPQEVDEAMFEESFEKIVEMADIQGKHEAFPELNDKTELVKRIYSKADMLRECVIQERQIPATLSLPRKCWRKAACADPIGAFDLSTIDEEYHDTVKRLVTRFAKDLISFSPTDHRVIRDYFLKLSLTDTSPLKVRPYPLSKAMEPVFRWLTRDLMDRGVIAPSEGLVRIFSPSFLVPHNSKNTELLREVGLEKANGTWKPYVKTGDEKPGTDLETGVRYRLVSNLIELNKRLFLHALDFQITGTLQSIARLQGSELFSSFDVKASFYSIPVDPRDRMWLGLSAPPSMGALVYLLAPLGLAVMPALLTQLIRGALRADLQCMISSHIDDILLGSLIVNHAVLVEWLLEDLDKLGILISADKVLFFQKEIDYLGHRITGKMIMIQQVRKDIMARTQLPASKAELASLIGITNFHAQHIQGWSMMVAILTPLLTPSSTWDPSPTQIRAMEEIRERYINAPNLWLVDERHPIFLYTDASAFATACVAYQVIDGTKRIVSYLSKKLSKTEVKTNSAIGKELLAIIHALTAFREIVSPATEKIVVTDNRVLALLFAVSERSMHSKLSRWISLVASLCPGLKIQWASNTDAGIKVADYLSRVGELGRFTNKVALPTEVQDQLYGGFDKLFTRWDWEDGKRFSLEDLEALGKEVGLSSEFKESLRILMEGRRPLSQEGDGKLVRDSVDDMLVDALDLEIRGKQVMKNLPVEALSEVGEEGSVRSGDSGSSTLTTLSAVIERRKTLPEYSAPTFTDYIADQRSDQTIKDIITRMSTKSGNKNLHKRYQLVGGHLLALKNLGFGGSPRIVVSPDLALETMAFVHLMSGHTGGVRLVKLFNRFYFSRRAGDVARAVAEGCRPCTVGRPVMKPDARKGWSPKAKAFGSVWVADHVTMRRVKAHGQNAQYILSIVDSFTSLQIGIPVDNLKGATAARHLEVLFGTLGAPSVLHSDNGPGLVRAPEVQRVCKKHGVRMVTGIPNRSTSHARIESMNRLIKLGAILTAREMKTNWLDAFTVAKQRLNCAMRTTTFTNDEGQKKKTLTSPHALAYQQESKEQRGFWEEVTQNPPGPEGMKWKKMLAHMKKDNTKYNADERLKDEKFKERIKVGDLVVLREEDNPTRRMTGWACEHLYRVAVRYRRMFKLTKVFGTQQLTKPYHVSHVKRFQVSEDLKNLPKGLGDYFGGRDVEGEVPDFILKNRVNQKAVPLRGFTTTDEPINIEKLEEGMYLGPGVSIVPGGQLREDDEIFPEFSDVETLAPRPRGNHDSLPPPPGMRGERTEPAPEGSISPSDSLISANSEPSTGKVSEPKGPRRSSRVAARQ